MVEQTLAAAKSLAGQSGELAEKVAFFNINDSAAPELKKDRKGPAQLPRKR